MTTSAYERTGTIASVLLGSTDPDRLRAWYCAALAPDQPQAEGHLDLDGFRFVFCQRDDVAGQNPEPGRTILNFHVADAHAITTRMNELGVTWLSEVEDRGPGLFGTLVDPDGNYLQIIEFKR